ncbi:MAG: response regulator transcription factor [Clostridia bacterium]|nr:response regulator transcription factor [Clostridia bacterium]
MINIEGISDKKILIIDDETDILNLLETVLLKEGFRRIYKAASGLKGIEACKVYAPDIIVLDIMLPDIDGYEVCRKLREFTLVPIIFLSAKSDDVDKILGIGIGGDDYVTKPFSPKEVAFRIKAQFRRSQLLGIEKNGNTLDKVIAFGNIELNPGTGEVKKSGKPLALTAKEYQLLLYMVENRNRVISKRKLCDDVWGEEYIGYDNAIMVHICHLREKIEDDPSSPKYIKTIKGLGYKLSAKTE